jgi:hypothetical protein
MVPAWLFTPGRRRMLSRPSRRSLPHRVAVAVQVGPAVDQVVQGPAVVGRAVQGGALIVAAAPATRPQVTARPVDTAVRRWLQREARSWSTHGSTFLVDACRRCPNSQRVWLPEWSRARISGRRGRAPNRHRCPAWCPCRAPSRPRQPGSRPHQVRRRQLIRIAGGPAARLQPPPPRWNRTHSRRSHSSRWIPGWSGRSLVDCPCLGKLRAWPRARHRRGWGWSSLCQRSLCWRIHSLQDLHPQSSASRRHSHHSRWEASPYWP